MSITSLDGFKTIDADDQGFWTDSSGVLYQDLEALLQTSVEDGLSFCPCGNPEVVIEAMAKYLESVLWVWADWENRCKTRIEHSGLGEIIYTLCSYIADRAELTEHGTSVGCAWLTTKGAVWLKTYRAMAKEELAQ